MSLSERFWPKPLDGPQMLKVERLRRKFHDAAQAVDEDCPDGWRKEEILHRLEELSMLATKAVSHPETPPPSYGGTL